MSTPEVDPMEQARQQMLVARQQAIALIATVDAALATMPRPAPQQPEKRLSFLGAEDEA